MVLVVVHVYKKKVLSPVKGLTEIHKCIFTILISIFFITNYNKMSQLNFLKGNERKNDYNSFIFILFDISYFGQFCIIMHNLSNSNIADRN